MQGHMSPVLIPPEVAVIHKVLLLLALATGEDGHCDRWLELERLPLEGFLAKLDSVIPIKIFALGSMTEILPHNQRHSSWCTSSGFA